MPDLGSGAARRVGSSPIIRTELNYKTLKINVLRVFYFYIPRLFPIFLFNRIFYIYFINFN
jgi:hypothetical protein